MRALHVRLLVALALVSCGGAGARAGSTGDAGSAGTPVDASPSVGGDAAGGGAAGDAGGSGEAGAAGEDGGTAGGESVTLGFASAAFTMYASIGGGPAHLVQLDTGSLGLYVPKSALGSAATVSSTETCSITYVSSGNVLSGHQATASVTLLGSIVAGDVSSPPATVPMPLCAVDDTTFTGGVMGVGFGRDTAPDPSWNVILEMSAAKSGAVRAGYVLSTHPLSVQIGVSSAASAGFQRIALTPSPSGDGDWVATSLTGCVALPKVPGYAPQCGGLLVDTGVPETLLWGPADPTLGGVVAGGATTVPAGTEIAITAPAPDGGVLDYDFTLGSGADSPSAVDIRTASAFSINTGRALLADYDYLFDAVGGSVGFRAAP